MGMVSCWPASVPKVVAGLPEIALLLSVQLATDRVKDGSVDSVTVTAVPIAVTLMGVGVAGAGVAATVVVIAAGALARFVWVKLKGPPIAPVVVFLTATVGVIGVLVSTQVICAAERTFVAGMVRVEPAKVPNVAGLPVLTELASEQETPVNVKGDVASVTVTLVFRFETAMAVAVVGVGVAAAVVVILAGAEARLPTVKANGPPATVSVDFFTATVAGFAALVKVQVICAAGKTLAAGIVSSRPTRLPNEGGLPVMAALASVQLAVVNV